MAKASFLFPFGSCWVFILERLKWVCLRASAAPWWTLWSVTALNDCIVCLLFQLKAKLSAVCFEVIIPLSQARAKTLGRTMENESK